MIKMINIIYRLVAPKFFEEAIEEINIDDVIVRPTYLSICQADQRYYQGKRASDVIEEKLPMALIHEGVGEVVFDNTGSFNVGDNVVMIPNTPTKKMITYQLITCRHQNLEAAVLMDLQVI